MSNQPRGAVRADQAGKPGDDDAAATAALAKALEDEAAAKATADAAKAKAEADASAAAAKATKGPAYHVAQGHGVTSQRGCLGENEECFARDFVGGEATLEHLVGAGILVKS